MIYGHQARLLGRQLNFVLPSQVCQNKYKPELYQQIYGHKWIEYQILMHIYIGDGDASHA
jgi:hypothetical protein